MICSVLIIVLTSVFLTFYCNSDINRKKKTCKPYYEAFIYYSTLFSANAKILQFLFYITLKLYNGQSTKITTAP